MRQRTKLPIANPKGKSEFQNFDRLVDVLLSKPVKSVRKEKLESARSTQDQEAAVSRRLPRP
jgi:hypothetical protein